MLELLSLLGGGLLRLAPEVLKWIDRKDERAHERAMFDKNLEADKLRGEQAQKLAETHVAGQLSIEDVRAMAAGVQAQAASSGIPWVDAINSLMRPALTFYWCIVLYTVALGCQYLALLAGGKPPVEAVLSLWGAPERAIVMSMISFWFVDRALRNGAGVK